MKKTKPKPRAKKRARKPVEPSYTHRDASGMRWRIEGGRPVSALADLVMSKVRGSRE